MSLTSLIFPDGDLRVVRYDIIEKIIKCCDCNSALLYLYIVKNGTRLNDEKAMKELNFEKEVYEKAKFTLTNLIIESEVASDINKNIKNNDLAKYTATEVRIAREKDHKFAAVCSTAENIFGNFLTETQAKSLYKIYDSIGLPADIIIELLMYLKRDRQTVTRLDIEREAYIWSDKGIYTCSEAQKYLEKIEAEKPLKEKIFKFMNIIGRKPSYKESCFASACIEKGFTPEAVELAIERMYKNIHGFSLNYLKKILNSWHEKGVHTVSEITSIEPETKNKQIQSTNSKDIEKLEDWELEWIKSIEKRLNEDKEA